jgi:Xaa-Pro aminopeptidase
LTASSPLVPALADSPPLSQRHAATRARLAALGLERLLVTALPNVAWLSGFHGSAGAVLLEPDRVALVIDRRYEEAADGCRAAGIAIVLVEQTYDETLVPLLAGSELDVGFEAVHLSVQRHRWLEASLAARGWPAPTRLRPTVDVIEAGRITKDQWEIRRLRHAARQLSAVLLGVLADLGAGVRERDVAQALEAGLRRTGAEKAAFDTIVASGPRAALPHGRAADRRLDAGDLVVLDFGGVYGGYCGDLTRTVQLAPQSDEGRRVHAAVAAAQDAAVEAIRPGALLVEADRAARAVLADAGLADRFVHGTGHGLGLEVHEAPRLGPARVAGSAGSPLSGTVPLPDTFVAGMVVTVEPGVYIPGWGGVRIEDDVLVTADGAVRLTDVPVTLAAGL